MIFVQANDICAILVPYMLLLLVVVDDVYDKTITIYESVKEDRDVKNCYQMWGFKW